MISLIYNNKEFNFTENILKISEHINTLYEDNNYDPVLEITSVNTIVNITDEVIHYFNLWFNELDKLEIVKYKIENVIFKPSIFKECDVKTLIDIFNFGFYFQIRMLCETIAYILSKNDIKEHDNKYYIEGYEIHLSIVMMMLKYMYKEQFEKQSLNVQNLIKWKKIHVLDLSNIKDYVILPHDKTEIHDNEFKGKNFKKVIIPSSITSIGDSAFYKCKSLEEIIIPNSVTSIGEYAFCECNSLKEVIIPNSVTSIGKSAFYGCKSLTKVVIPNNVISIGECVFWGTGLKEVVIPDSVTSIGYQAFYHCTSLKEVVIPNSVTSIGKSAFNWCTSLKEIIIPSSVTSIGECAFYDCWRLTRIVIPKAQRLSVTSIGKSAFEYCESLKEVTLPKDLNYPFNQNVKIIRV